MSGGPGLTVEAVVALIEEQFRLAEEAGDSPKRVDDWLDELSFQVMIAKNIILPTGVAPSWVVSAALSEVR